MLPRDEQKTIQTGEIFVTERVVERENTREETRDTLVHVSTVHVQHEHSYTHANTHAHTNTNIHN